MYKMKKKPYNFNPDITTADELLIAYQNTQFKSDNKIANICSILFDTPRNAMWGINGYMKHEILSCGNTAEILVKRIWSYAHDEAFDCHVRNARDHIIRGRWARRRIFRWLYSDNYDRRPPTVVRPLMYENEKRLQSMYEQIGAISQGTIYRSLTSKGAKRRHSIKLISDYKVIIQLIVYQRSVLDIDYLVYNIYVGDINRVGVIEFFNYLIDNLQYQVVMSGHNLYGDIMCQYDVEYSKIHTDKTTLYSIKQLR